MRQPREVQFPMPWGHMGAQEWGEPTSARKIIAVHGWMDNSNSFQRLFPMLLSSQAADLHIVAVDLSGHGLSSHRGLGCSYTLLEFAIDLKRLLDQLGWENFAIVAHSMGAMISLLLASLFPELISHLVSIDIVTIMACPIEAVAEVTAWNIQNMLAFERKHGTPPVYKDLDDVVDRRMLTTPDTISRESAKIIMRRSVVDYQGGVVLRTDPRLKWCRTLNYSYDDQLEMLKRYKGRLLVIKATGTPHKQLKSLPVEKFTAVYEEHCEHFRMVEVDGTHTVHLDDPDKVLNLIVDFLQSYEGATMQRGADEPGIVEAKL